jgi:hypothetical protein
MPASPASNPEGPPLRISLAAIVLLAAILGFAVLLADDYQYGPMDQTVLAQRVLDQDFLAGDFYVDQTAGFGPRYYFVQLLAALSRVWWLPGVSLVLAWLANAGVALVTMLAARDLTSGDRWATVLAGVLVVAVRSTFLGAACFLHGNLLSPHLLTLPLALAAVWMGIRGRYLTCAACVVPAIWIHPLLAPASAGIALLAGAGTALLNGRNAAPRDAPPQRVLLRIAAAFAIVGGTFVLAWGRYDPGQLSTGEFIAIYARFRNAHHCIPSDFVPIEYATLAAFLAATALAWHAWRKEPTTPGPEAARLLATIGIVLLGCVGGYVFVEVWPTRLWATAQPFRFLLIAKWLGLILLAASAARALRTGTVKERIGGALLLAGTGVAQSGAVLLGQLIVSVPAAVNRKALRRALAALGIVGVAAALWLGVGHEQGKLLVGLLAAVAIVWAARRRRLWLPATAFALFLALFAVHNHRQLPLLWRVLDPLRLHISPATTGGRIAGIARAARDATPPDAVFFAPPDFRFGDFRDLANRALVVDVRFYPFTAAGMKDWRQRVAQCYGPTEGALEGALPALEQHYRALDDDALCRLARAYGATHAVIYPDMPTQLPLIARTEHFRIVEIPPTNVAEADQPPTPDRG